MVDKSLIPRIKQACLGIGLRRIGDNLPLMVSGTGFIVDPEGFVITADHVITGLIKERNKLNSEGYKVEIAGFRFNVKNEDNAVISGSAIKEIRKLVIKIDDLGDYVPEEHDIAICRLIGKYDSLPSLNIKKPVPLDMYDEIFLCGYPGGDFTFTPIDKMYGRRISPLIQTGRIASLMPADTTRHPIGIQTDIVGTGGSSGSPIINATDGEVIGIAQRVIPSLASNFKQETIGSVTVGLVWGVSNYFIYDSVKKMIDAMKKMVDENGYPLDESGKDDILKISFTAGDGSFPDFKKTL